MEEARVATVRCRAVRRKGEILLLRLRGWRGGVVSPSFWIAPPDSPPSPSEHRDANLDSISQDLNTFRRRRA